VLRRRSPPPRTPPTVSIDVFGARGALLTAVVSSTDCATASQKLAANPCIRRCRFAVTQNGSAVAWGNPVWGGQTSTAAAITGISQLYASERGFAALLSDNTIKAWGSSYVAVSDPNLVYPATGAIATSPLTNVATVMPGRLAYFVTKKDGSIAAWGNFRGITDGVDGYIGDAKTGLNPVTLALLSDVKAQASTEGAYALLKGDGTVVTFGDQDAGGKTNAAAYQSAIANGSVIVVAAGNEALDARLSSPANCPGVITVASNSITGGRASYSNYGATVSVTAPGGGFTTAADRILSTLPSGKTVATDDTTYGLMAGTSQATPHVAGVIALMMAVNPKLTSAQVRSILIKTARPAPANCPGCGAGIVDAAAAVKAASGN